MSRFRDGALVVALLVVGVAAIWGPRPAGSTSSLPSGAAPSVPVGDPSIEPSQVAGTLTVSAANVVTTATPDRATVLSVRLTARVRATSTVMLRADPTGPAIRFSLVAPQSSATIGTLRSTPPSILAAGATTSLDLTFDLRGLSLVPGAGELVAAGAPPAPGTWLLTVDLVDVAGARHHAETPVTVSPTA
ncbi:MAG TPA: hypothetical protein VGI98_08815 [Candidatus Limnocylindrales bacterium]|jgi:hypothetical protein